jgi:two-component system, chemotaxis family, protein-glutamate methylesterase/glutaminase
VSTARVVVLVGSQGSLPVVRDIVAGLPADLGAAVLVCQHRVATHEHLLVEIMRHRASLPVEPAIAGEALTADRIVVAPAGGQLAVDAGGRLAIGPGPGRADPVLTSCADVFGGAVVAVILSGRLSDGAAGARAVKRAGGMVLVQDPASAARPEMPTAAITTGCVDLVLPSERLGPALAAFADVAGAMELFRGRSQVALETA